MTAVAQVGGRLAIEVATDRLRLVSHFTDIGSAAGGVPRSTLEIGRLMAAGGHRYTVLTAPGWELPEEWRDTRQPLPEIVPLEPVRHKLHLLSPAALATARRLLCQADLLLLHGMWRPRNTQLAGLARRIGVPYVMVPHGMLDDWPMGHKPLRKRLYHRLFESANLARAASVITTSEAERRQAGRWIPHGRLKVVPLPISPVLARRAGEPEPAAAGDDGEPTVLFLSRLHPKKGAEILLEAVGLLARRGVRCRLLVSGAGERRYERRLQRLAERLGIADRTQFLGWVDGRRKLALYKRADLLALPTSQENFGRVLVESMLCRTPVVTTRETGLWREIHEAGGGLLVDRTAEAFAEAIAGLHADRPRRERMGEAGRDYVLRWLDDGRLLGRYESLLRRAADGGDGME